MYIAKGMYRTTEPQPTIFEALLTLFTASVVKSEHSLRITLKADGYNSSTYLYSTEFTPMEALEDAVLCHYKKFGIKIFKEL